MNTLPELEFNWEAASDYGDMPTGVCLRWPRLPVRKLPFPPDIVEKVTSLEVPCSHSYIGGLQRLYNMAGATKDDLFIYKFDTVIRDRVYDQVHFGVVRSFFLLFQDLIRIPKDLKMPLWQGRWNEIATALYAASIRAGAGTWTHLAQMKSGNPATNDDWERRFGIGYQMPTIYEIVIEWAVRQ